MAGPSIDAEGEDSDVVEVAGEPDLGEEQGQAGTIESVQVSIDSVAGPSAFVAVGKNHKVTAPRELVSCINSSSRLTPPNKNNYCCKNRF